MGDARDGGEKRLLIIGSSDGIGLATARRLVDAGWSVTGVSRSPARLAAPGYQHELADVSAADYPARLAEIVAARGPYPTCIYAAGIGHGFDPERLGRDREVFLVNLMGALHTAEIVVPPMLAAGRGHLIVLSSQADELVVPDSPSYSASKAAVSSYFEGLGLALRRKGVAVTNVRFGFVNTKMARSSVRPFMMSADEAAAILERTLTRRPIRVTRPRRMAVIVAVLRWLQRWQVRLARVR